MTQAAMAQSSKGMGYVGVLTGIALLVFVALVGLITIGRDVLVLAFVRLGLLVALLGFGQALGVAGGSRLGRIGWLLAAVGAGFYLLAALGWVITDGWWFNPFASDGPATPPWYAYVIGLSGIGFAVGTLLVGIAAWRRHGAWPALLAVLAGLLFGLALPLGALGHLLWIAPWIALSAWLAIASAPAAPRGAGDSPMGQPAL